MTKITNPGWPEPSDWVQRLHDELEHLGEDYQAISWDEADDPESFEGLNVKQTRAAEVLVAVCSALREIPLFEKSSGAAVLHDIACALSDVVMGGEPRLFKSVPAGAPGGDGMYRNYVKEHVILAVRLLVEAHQIPEGRAIKTVAEKFSNAGATGRKGDPLSISTVKDWCTKTNRLSLNHEDVRINRSVERKLAKFRENPEWPGMYDNALAWVEQLASDPLIKSKYG